MPGSQLGFPAKNWKSFRKNFVFFRTPFACEKCKNFSFILFRKKRKAKISRKKLCVKKCKKFRENEKRKFCVNKYGREIIHYDTIKLPMKSSQSREFNNFFLAGKCFKQNLWFPRNLALFSQFFA